jgi:hypothetical protein
MTQGAKICITIFYKEPQATYIRVTNSNVPTIRISSLLIIEGANFPTDVIGYKLGIATTMATY